jgi:cytochrome c biogenesis protein CcdA
LLAAVAVFATGTGGFLAGLGAFAIFAVTMATLVFLLAVLRASAGQSLTRSLRVWGRRVQVVTALMILFVGTAIVYASFDAGALNRAILGS